MPVIVSRGLMSESSSLKHIEPALNAITSCMQIVLTDMSYHLCSLPIMQFPARFNWKSGVC
jgi:hypothetical protein